MKLLNVNQIEEIIRSYEFILLDPDGTLMHTDVANYLAYAKAIDILNLNIELKFKRNVRVSANYLKKKFNLSEDLVYELKHIKKKWYNKYLQYVEPNLFWISLVRKYRDTHAIYIVSDAEMERVYTVLDLFRLHKYFKCIYSNAASNVRHGSKYYNFIKLYRRNRIDLKTTLIVEDSVWECVKALNSIFCSSQKISSKS